MSTKVCAKFRCAPLRIKKTLGINKELIPTRTTTTTTRVAFGDPPSGSKNMKNTSQYMDVSLLNWVNLMPGL